MSAKFTIKNTHRYGKGVYASRTIKKGESIHQFKGRRLTVRQVVDKLIAGKEFLDDPLQIGRRTYLDLDETSRSFNHSCNPNAGMRNTGELFAIRDIATGEEITYDYSATIGPTEWEMECRCGAQNCRRVLHDVRSIPKRQLETYRRAGALQRYMKGVIKELENGTYAVPAYERVAVARLKAAGIQ